MGWVQGKGSAKAHFPVSMKWSGVSGAGTLLRRWGPGESEGSPAMGVSGERGGSLEWWVQAARRPASGQAAIRLEWLRNGLDALEEPRPGGWNGGAQRAPFPRWCCSTTHILRFSGMDRFRVYYGRTPVAPPVDLPCFSLVQTRNQQNVRKTIADAFWAVAGAVKGRSSLLRKQGDDPWRSYNRRHRPL